MNETTQQTTKVCGCCKKELSLDEFSVKVAAKGTRQSKCKACVRAYGKTHYRSKVGTYVAKAAVHNERYRAENAEYVRLSLVGKSCLHCGSTEDLTYYQGVGATEQPVHMALHAAVSKARVQEAINRSDVHCKPCLQGVLAMGIEPWSRMTREQRAAFRASNPPHPRKTNPGMYKNYRRVTRKVSGEGEGDK